MGATHRTGKDELGEGERPAPETGLVGSRRSLLGAAGGGLVLAARSLLLPGWLGDEAAAAGHPVRNVQSRKQKRRHKHRRDLKHRRKAQRNKQGPAPGNNWRSGITFHIFNDGSSPLAIDSYSYYADGGIFSPEAWQKAYSDTVNPGQALWDRTGRQESAVFIDQRFWLMANNPFVGWPEIYLRYDGKIEPSTFVGYTGKVSISGMGFVVDLPAIERTIDGRHFSIKREENESYDGQPHILFAVHIS
jgi:hypothetical protein